MKKFLALLMTCLMIFGLWSCKSDSDQTPEDSTTAGSEETTSAPDSSEEQEIPMPSDAALTVALNSATENVRLLGEREIHGEASIGCRFVGSGFEMKINAEGGTVLVGGESKDKSVFRVWIDGEAHSSADGTPYYTLSKKDGIVIPNISAGEHTLKVVKISGTSDTTLTGVTFDGTQAEHASADSEHFIEFVGDSISAGVSVAEGVSDASQAYPYMIAEAMGADYSVTAYESRGLVYGEKLIGDLYGKDEEGDFSRKADIVVINVGSFDIIQTGDNTVSAAQFRQAYANLVESVRAVNGNKCKIVCLSTSGKQEFRDAITDICETLGGEEKGYFLKLASVSRAEPPTAEEHAAYATELKTYLDTVKAIQIIIPELVPTAPATDPSISFESDEWKTV